jgi:hypothetical protein
VSGQDRHAQHVAAGVWNDVCIPCGATNELCRQIESAGAGAAERIVRDLPAEKRREVLQRLGQRKQTAQATLERMRAAHPEE